MSLPAELKASARARGGTAALARAGDRPPGSSELTADERLAVAWALQRHLVEHEHAHLLSPGFDRLLESARAKLLATSGARR